MKTHHRWRLVNNTDPGDNPHTGPEPGDDPGHEPATGPPTYTWTTPAGITITDQPPPPLHHDT